MKNIGEISNTDSETSMGVLNAASFLIGAASELQDWSGCLDWSRRLTHEGVLQTPEIIKGFSRVSRSDFLPENQKPDEGFDRPLSIGEGQTNSQPSMVAKMLELLQPRRGHAILDVGAGSGWTTALLASIAGRAGSVVGTERIQELAEFGSQNLAKYEFPSAKIVHTPTTLGSREDSPYNRILVSAHMLDEWVPDLITQLSPRGGILVAPIGTKADHGDNNIGEYKQQIVVLIRRGSKMAAKVGMRGVAFVPLVYGE